MSQINREIPNNFNLPRRISRLGQLAYNLWWVWNSEAQILFPLIDKTLWDTLYHNPVAFLHQASRPSLNAVIQNSYYLDIYDRVMKCFDELPQTDGTWYNRTYPHMKDKLVAYFSFEFGLHESLQVYAGGLGVLSGDHLKEASDLGIPMVGIGFIYNMGYFSQAITEDGWQETRNVHLNFSDMPLISLTDENNNPLVISIVLAGRTVSARIWEVRVGRIPLYLLDTNVDQNSETDRNLTAQLYSNDPEIRISQEILLGIGGVRALRKLGYSPDVWHMNEGHSAFLILERIQEYMRQGLSYDEASKIVKATDIFTTHTPVPAGNDQFPIWLVDKYFSAYWEAIKLSRDEFVSLAKHAQPWGETFSMPVLALKLSDQRNAVSELHGQVSRKMWQSLWPDKKIEDVPITHITNGIHTGSWISRELLILFEKYLGSDWMENLDDLDMWAKIDLIPDAELWNVRRYLKRKLVSFATERIRKQWFSGSIHAVQTIAGGVMLNSQPLTIGFARRFATYKRSSLILRDYERLMNIINNPERPVQLIYAGKAHPADEPGKLLIQEVYRTAKDSKIAGRLVFIEDYDMNVARHLVQGVDVWLNTPRIPNEASGTSGMKAALNGSINCSILDGWWHEAYNGRNGWAIGKGNIIEDSNQADIEESTSLYNLLENEIIPLYYGNRNDEGIPVEWISRIKESIRTLAPQFSMRRMVKEYMTQLYTPALEYTCQPEKPEM